MLESNRSCLSHVIVCQMKAGIFTGQRSDSDAVGNMLDVDDSQNEVGQP